MFPHMTAHFSYNCTLLNCRPHARLEHTRAGKLDVGIADDQARDFDFIKTEMKYDSTGMFHWIPARAIEDCILVSDSRLIQDFLVLVGWIEEYPLKI